MASRSKLSSELAGVLALGVLGLGVLDLGVLALGVLALGSTLSSISSPSFQMSKETSDCRRLSSSSSDTRQGTWTGCIVQNQSS